MYGTHTSFHQLSSEKQTLEVWATGMKHPTQLYDDDFITHYKGLHILGYIYIYGMYIYISLVDRETYPPLKPESGTGGSQKEMTKEDAELLLEQLKNRSSHDPNRTGRTRWDEVSAGKNEDDVWII